MEITIRPAMSDDAPAFTTFAEYIFRETFAHGCLDSDMDMHCAKDFSPAIQQQEILDPNIVTLLAEINGDLVGFTQLKLESKSDDIKAKKAAELYRLYVSPDQQGKGLAHKLIQAALDAASSNNSDAIWLGVWEHNPKAITFYKKYGFTVVGEHIFQLGLDPQLDLIMATEIDAQTTVDHA